MEESSQNQKTSHESSQKSSQETSQESSQSQKTGQEGTVWEDRKHFMWFPFSFTKYCVRKGRIFIDRGFFNTVQDQTLLYRIIDIQMRRSLPQRIFGTGTVVLVTKADMSHEILLENIKHPQEVNDMLSDMIEELRHQRNVIGREFYSSDPGIPPMPDGPGDMPSADDFMDFDDMR